VVLAAGASTRLGEPKQLVKLRGETLLARSLRVAAEAECSPVVVVLGAEHTRVIENSCFVDVEIVVNENWIEGMGSSIRLGVRQLETLARDARGVVLMTCDQPAVTAQHLRLIAAQNELKASYYEGRRGIPAYLPAEYFGRLTMLRGDVGARELLVDARCEELLHGELDVDTAGDLERAKLLFG
jgi:molybdenum cofactor cytidylyltransferase